LPDEFRSAPLRRGTGELDLSEHDLRLVTRILRQHAPATQVFAFGSRVRRTAKRFSDLDLVVQSASPISLEHLGALRSQFSESDLPISVDIVDWWSLTPEFRRLVEPEMVRIYP
jgi:uncharacterized protein